MARRRHFARGIRVHRNYTVDEAARALGMAKGTVRRWLKAGLPAIMDQKPLLILGADLVDHLTAKAGTSQKCRLDQCFCFSCRTPREPAFSAAEFIPMSARSGNLRALCGTCSAIMHKRVSTAKLPDLQAVLDVTILHAGKPIGDGQSPCRNDHLHKEPETHA